MEDGVTLVGSSGGPGALASEGSATVTEIGAGASTGDVVSKGPVFLRAGGKIDGSVDTGQSFTQQAGAIVVGSITEHEAISLPGLPAYAIQTDRNRSGKWHTRVRHRAFVRCGRRWTLRLKNQLDRAFFLLGGQRRRLLLFGADASGCPSR